MRERRKDTSIALLAVAMFIGAALPAYFFPNGADSANEISISLVGVVIFCYLYALWKKVTRNKPELEEWVTATHTRRTFLVFTAAFATSLLACLYGLLPLDYWLKIGLTALLAIIAWLLLINATSRKVDENGN